ncbi:MAG: NAD(P)/FAD-dependent oxidoreductase [Candidatus Omnitrophica bacterium]|nr:NAD(P)/FAD-dependent oxidoreductase [Candidatus Omnitrophota bacterium]
MISLAGIPFDESRRRLWDVVVIGAGPAGAVTACQAARAGAAVLLVDKSFFPRQKVCGCCLNSQAVELLEGLGLGTALRRCPVEIVRELKLAARGRSFSMPLPPERILSRERLDTSLVEEAVEAGVSFLPATAGLVGGLEKDLRLVRLERLRDSCEARARVVVAADGLGGCALRLAPEFSSMLHPASRIGIGTVLHSSCGFYRPGVIYMACGPDGYAGLVRLEDGRLDVAAAVDAASLKKAPSCAALIGQLLQTAGFPIPDELPQAAWRGTSALTRRQSRLGSERLFVVGDAASFVEPFTGQGIGWAFLSGAAVAPLVIEASRRWEPSLVPEWEKRYRRVVGRRQIWCRLISALLRRDPLIGLTARVLARLPWLCRPIIRSVSRPVSGISERGLAR